MEINANCVDFTLLLCIGRLRNVQSFKMLLLCQLDLLFFHVLVTVAVLVCLRSLLLHARE